jgi:hypothetical protein
VRILRTAKSELEEADYRLMRKAVGVIRRHLAQRPENIVTSRWRYALMNWGHDPLKDQGLLPSPETGSTLPPWPSPCTTAPAIRATPRS